MQTGAQLRHPQVPPIPPAVPFATEDSPPIEGAGPPTSGPAGTGAGFATPGSRYLDTTGAAGLKIVYVNIGTLASPTWAPQTMGDSV